MTRELGSELVRPAVAFAAAFVFAILALAAFPAAAAAQNVATQTAVATLTAAVTQVAAPVQTVAATEYSASQTGAAKKTFTDVRGDEWFAEAVYALAAEGVVQGRHDGSFGPDEPLSRAQMAAFLARVLELPESPGEPFIDVEQQDWFSGAVGSLYVRRLVLGTSAFVFSPNEPVSRQQAASLVMRSLGWVLAQDPESDLDYALGDDEAAAWLAGFRDRVLIAPDHAEAVANAYRLGVMEGATDGWFYPALNLTRAQMAVMLYRAFLQPVQMRNVYPVELPAVSTYATQSAGSEGTLVLFVEARLTALGYPCGPVDGVYDYRTKDAVMAFEKVERLARDGVVGPEVWQRIFSALTPTPRFSASGDRAEVDLTRQVLFMISDNRVWKIVHVSTGKLGTITGHHKVGAKYEGWVECVTLEGRMYYPSYIVSRTAIHGYPFVPPYPASHGCIRTPIWLAIEVYEALPRGTVVDVHY